MNPEINPDIACSPAGDIAAGDHLQNRNHPISRGDNRVDFRGRYQPRKSTRKSPTAKMEIGRFRFEVGENALILVDFTSDFIPPPRIENGHHATIRNERMVVVFHMFELSKCSECSSVLNLETFGMFGMIQFHHPLV